VQALGGAKNPHVVLATPIWTSPRTPRSTPASAGRERCMAISVVVAGRTGRRRPGDRIRLRITDLKVGDGMRPDSQMGPLSPATPGKVFSYLDAVTAAGAKARGRRRAVKSPASPAVFWLGPTLFDQVTPQMSIYTDEIFGPVLSVVRAQS